ncbi:MAG: M56 family metallopeptidase [Lachnospiraceae bacterium]|nr:M56 family metallopeptidase [Lachnospiraceae bacterium]
MYEEFFNVFNVSIIASWLILAIIAARLLLKKAPRWIIVLLWGLAAIRLVVPFPMLEIQTPVSLIPSAKTISPTSGSEEIYVHSGFNVIDNALNTTLVNNSFIEDSSETISNIIDICIKLWIIGIITCLSYTFISFIVFKLKLRASIPYEKNIWLSDYISAPFIIGIIKPQIYLPSNIDKQDIENVLAHECAHIKRKDHVWKLIGFIITSVYWFNPVIWIAYNLFCKDIEIACDEKVVSKLELPLRKSYANSLVSLSLPKKMLYSCPLSFSTLGVKERVEKVVFYRKPSLYVFIVSIVVFSFIGLCFLTNPGIAEGKVDNVEINTDKNSVYSEEDINSAIDVVIKDFKHYRGCEMTDIRYGSDGSESYNIEGFKHSAETLGIDPENAEYMVLYVTFECYDNTEGSSAAFNLGEYKWEWELTREKGTKQWIIVNHGDG